MGHFHAQHGREAPLLDKLNDASASCLRRDG
jgi:hypothetical protein